MLVPMFLLEFFHLGGFMGRVLNDLERIVLLERKIGLMLNKGGPYLEEVSSCEEMRAQVVDRVLQESSLDDLYAVYKEIALEPKDDLKMEKILAIIDLIDQKTMSIERGR